MYEFEGEKFYSFENYDKALSDVYGDYMWIPPEEKRERHIIVELELSKYAQMEE